MELKTKKYVVRGFHTEEDVYYKIGKDTDVIFVSDDKETALQEAILQQKNGYFSTMVRENGLIIAFVRCGKFYYITHINKEAKQAISSLHNAFDERYDIFVITNKEGKTDLYCEDFLSGYNKRSVTYNDIFDGKYIGEDVDAVRNILESLKEIIPGPISSVTINTDYISSLNYVSVVMFYRKNDNNTYDVFYRNLCEGGE